MEKSEYRPQQRAGLIVWLLAQGVRLSTAEVARRTARSSSAARAMLNGLAAVVPLVQDAQGRWALCDGDGQMRPMLKNRGGAVVE
jgi:hypothetical protein